MLKVYMLCLLYSFINKLFLMIKNQNLSTFTFFILMYKMMIIKFCVCLLC